MLLTIILNVKFASILRYVRTLSLVTKTVKTGLHITWFLITHSPRRLGYTMISAWTGKDKGRVPSLILRILLAVCRTCRTCRTCRGCRGCNACRRCASVSEGESTGMFKVLV